MKLIVILVFGFIILFSQTAHAEWNAVEHHSVNGSSRFTLGLGHTHISEGKVDGKTKWIALPSWSLNYDYWISNKWAVGLQNDLILETFVIEDHKEELIEQQIIKP